MLSASVAMFRRILHKEQDCNVLELVMGVPPSTLRLRFRRAPGACIACFLLRVPTNLYILRIQKTCRPKSEGDNEVALPHSLGLAQAPQHTDRLTVGSRF